MAIPAWKHRAAAVVLAGYGGEEAGTGLAHGWAESGTLEQLFIRTHIYHSDLTPIIGTCTIKP